MIRNKIDGIINSITNKINSKVSYLIDTFSIVINILNEATVFYWAKWICDIGQGSFIPKAKTFVELIHLFIKLNESLFSTITISLQRHSPRERSSI